MPKNQLLSLGRPKIYEANHNNQLLSFQRLIIVFRIQNCGDLKPNNQLLCLSTVSCYDSDLDLKIKQQLVMTIFQ